MHDRFKIKARTLEINVRMAPPIIAQPFMAGFTVREFPKSRQGRKVLALGYHCLSSLAGLGNLDIVVPSHKWPGYFHGNILIRTLISNARVIILERPCTHSTPA